MEFFHDAKSALHHPDFEEADCYIVDFMLGGTLNGIQLLEQLRKKMNKPVNAVIMTGDTSTAFVRESDVCDWPVLYKPVNVSKLIASLKTQMH